VTKPRAIASASLAYRGVPEHWATEEEAAALSGMAVTKFAATVERLEAAGFPPQSAWNGKRFIPAIRAFWDREHSKTVLPGAAETGEDGERDKENWGDDRQRTRTAFSA
jgi:hypothetical protein